MIGRKRSGYAGDAVANLCYGVTFLFPLEWRWSDYMTLSLLMKFTNKLEFAEKLVKLGELNIAPFKNFDKYDDENIGRNDWIEVVTQIRQADKLKEENVKVIIGDIEIYGDALDRHGTFFKIDDSKKDYKIYSLTGLKEIDEDFDPAMKKFGDFVVVIHNPKEFLKRINKAVYLENGKRHFINKITCHAGWCDYQNTNLYDKNIWSEFHKKVEHEYQKEFRIVFNDPLANKDIRESIFIGDISDIAIYGTCEDLIKDK